MSPLPNDLGATLDQNPWSFDATGTQIVRAGCSADLGATLDQNPWSFDAAGAQIGRGIEGSYRH
jgi:hypothetical protein